MMIAELLEFGKRHKERERERERGFVCLRAVDIAKSAKIMYLL
jgi:hypothetical protein